MEDKRWHWCRMAMQEYLPATQFGNSGLYSQGYGIQAQVRRKVEQRKFSGRNKPRSHSNGTTFWIGEGTSTVPFLVTGITRFSDRRYIVMPSYRCDTVLVLPKVKQIKILTNSKILITKDCKNKILINGYCEIQTKLLSLQLKQLIYYRKWK